MDTRGPTLVLRVVSGILVILGTAVLVGWAMGVAALTSVVPGLATMKPATATGFLVSGVSFALLAFPGLRTSVTQRALALGTALLGALTVLEYRLPWEGGFDGLYLWQVDGDGPYPARMSEMTAISFLITGVGLSLVRTERAWRWTQGLGITLAAISIIAVVGYWYDVDALYAIDPFSSMALHTAVGFAVVAVGLVCTSSDRGLVALAGRDSVGSMTLRRYLIPAAAGPLLVGWLQVHGVRIGLFDHEFGTAVAASASALLLAGIVWGYAWWLDHAETQRLELEAQLHRAQRLESR